MCPHATRTALAPHLSAPHPLGSHPRTHRHRPRSAPLGSIHPPPGTLPSPPTPHAMSRAPRPRVASSHISLLVPTCRPEVRVSTMHHAVASIVHASPDACAHLPPRCACPHTPSRRLWTHRSTLAPTCRPDVRAPPSSTHVSTLNFPRRTAEALCTHTDYNSMDEWGEMQYRGAIQMAPSARAHRMPVL